ncbi:hypothetical protein VA337_19665 [Paenarthrobacter ureafaciens]|nr:hypothetical protein [Paenarthrobacter ureafaciens]MEC3854020.1 hypothetical protein [Paenarthrobacter ureafaciens]
MAIWDLTDELNHPLDFLLIQNGLSVFSISKRSSTKQRRGCETTNTRSLRLTPLPGNLRLTSTKTLPWLWISLITTAPTWMLSTIASAT